MPNLKLGHIFGVLVWIHWSFFVLLVLRGAMSLSAGVSPAAAAEDVLFIVMLFVCVTLHEFGHAFAAKRFGIRTRDIILTPLGGLARLEGGRWTPLQELIIAIAGPAVNVLIVLCLVPVVAFDAVMSDVRQRGILAGDFVSRLLLANIILIVFNMIPAFPMDGGRVLRALVGFVTDFRTATVIAVRVGQVCAVGIGALGIYTASPIVVIIAVFVFTAATAELSRVRQAMPPS